MNEWNEGGGIGDCIERAEVVGSSQTTSPWQRRRENINRPRLLLLLSLENFKVKDADDEMSVIGWNRVLGDDNGIIVGAAAIRRITKRSRAILRNLSTFHKFTNDVI